MTAKKFILVRFLVVVLILMGCGPLSTIPRLASTQPGSTPSQIETIVKANDIGATQTAAAGGSSVRPCDFIPGKSAPAQMPPDAFQLPFPTVTPPGSAITPSAVDAETTSKQLAAYQIIWNAVNDHYVNRDFNGKNWTALGQKYQDLIKKGLKQDDYYQAMNQMLYDLDSGLSFLSTPSEVSAQNNGSSGAVDFVGIGGQFTDIPIAEGKKEVLQAVYPGSPAEKAGLKAHDTLLKVDGGPFYDEKNQPRTLGAEGSPVTLTVQSPGQEPRDVTLIRQRIHTMLPIDICLVSGTRIGYLHWQGNLDDQLDSRTSAAINQIGESGLVQGLIIDTRGVMLIDLNVEKSVLSLFASGELGKCISPSDGSNLLDITSPKDVKGSQTVPIVFLQDETSQFVAQSINGVLQAAGRARIVGGVYSTPVYDFNIYDPGDQSKLYIPYSEIQPKGKSMGEFNHNGVIPDVSVPARWDMFTEATDPLLAKAIELLMKK